MNEKILLECRHVKKYFDTPKGKLHAVDDISFQLPAGHTLGVVGESGCGKSTLGRTILNLIPATSGEIIFDGENILSFSKSRMRQQRRKMQMIFQDPYASLHPKLTVSQSIEEALLIHKATLGLNAAQRTDRLYELMDLVGLDRRYVNTYPHELDGGRRQRIGIARALAVNPEFIVCDEPVSALDVSIQAQILNLLQQLQRTHGLSYLFITHNLSVVKHISDDIMVMYLGCLVEKCPAKELFKYPLHPYTKGLLSAIPIPSIHHQKERILLSGELSSPVNPKPGCRFAARCPYAREECFQTMPPLVELMEGHTVACHFAKEINNM